MSWFSRGRGSSDSKGQQPAVEPFVANDQIVARVDDLMNRWNDAVGNDAKMRATASDISSAAGIDEKFYMSGAWIGNPAMVHERPWQMLAAVAQRAAEQGNYVLAGRIFGFVSLWSTQIAPSLRPADWFDMRLDKVPPALEAEIAVIGFNSLRQLPKDQTIFSNTTGTATAGELLPAAALTLVQAAAKGVAVDAGIMADAQVVLG
jgi:hypothetical protein